MSLEVEAPPGEPNPAHVFITPSALGDPERFERAARWLRAHSPIAVVDVPAFEPFYVVTRHRDVAEISRGDRTFMNAPRAMLLPRALDATRRSGLGPIRPLIEMDGALHAAHRALLVPHLVRCGGAGIDPTVAQAASSAAARMMQLAPECELVTDIAQPFALSVLSDVLGLTDDSAEVLSGFLSGPAEDGLPVMVRHFADLLSARHHAPGEDLVSTLALAEIDGAPLPAAQMISHLLTLVTAGYETTVATIAGGLAALIDDPNQWAKLRGPQASMGAAVEEIIRWVTPIRGFMRTAVDRAVVAGHVFEPGDSVLLSYASANRDEDVFKDPYRFDLERSANRHLGFGVGVHSCLGASIARRASRAFLTMVLPHLSRAETIGDRLYSQSLLTGGLRALRIRYDIDQAPSGISAATTRSPRA